MRLLRPGSLSVLFICSEPCCSFLSLLEKRGMWKRISASPERSSEFRTTFVVEKWSNGENEEATFPLFDMEVVARRCAILSGHLGADCAPKVPHSSRGFGSFPVTGVFRSLTEPIERLLVRLVLRLSTEVGSAGYDLRLGLHNRGVRCTSLGHARAHSAAFG